MYDAGVFRRREGRMESSILPMASIWLFPSLMPCAECLFLHKRRKVIQAPENGDV